MGLEVLEQPVALGELLVVREEPGVVRRHILTAALAVQVEAQALP